MVANFEANLKDPDRYDDAKAKRQAMAQPLNLGKQKKHGKLNPDGSEGKSKKEEAVELLRDLLSEDED